MGASERERFQGFKVSALFVSWWFKVQGGSGADEEIDELADAGVEELVIQWGGYDDIEGLEALSEEVLPHVIQ